MNARQAKLAYIIKNGAELNITCLMKLSYFIDLVSYKKLKRAIIGYEYKRYTFGPFDKAIYNDAELLLAKGIIFPIQNYTASGQEFITYDFNTNTEYPLNFDSISKEEKQIIDYVLEELSGLGARVLTEMAYKTAPMKKFRATKGGAEHLNEKLDLSTINQPE